MRLWPPPLEICCSDVCHGDGGGVAGMGLKRLREPQAPDVCEPHSGWKRLGIGANDSTKILVATAS